MYQFKELYTFGNTQYTTEVRESPDLIMLTNR